jgi:hypothetical protein
MAHTKDQRGPGTLPTGQEQVVIGILSDRKWWQAPAVAEAMAYAQEYLPERLPTPVSTRTAGQYLGMLRTRGYVECDPPAGSGINIPHRQGNRNWRLLSHVRP